jgi:nucleotide-binding universal stress UspA family protein
MANGYAHIACCLDGSAAGDAALAAAIRMQALGDGRLTLVHVMEAGLEYAGFSTDVGAKDAEHSRAWLEQMVALVPGADGVLLDGHAPTVVCEWAAGQGVDLLVAVRHHGRAERILLGSFASHLAYNAPSAVLLVHPPTPAG